MSSKPKRNVLVIVLCVMLVLALSAAGLYALRRARQMYGNLLTTIKASKETEDTVAGGHTESLPEPYAFDYSWIESGSLIAHAMGGIDGATYTNSLEAFRENYALGHRIFEVDMDYTKDDYSILLCHSEAEWRAMSGVSDELPFTRENFLSSKLLGKYTPLDLPALIRLMAEHPDVTVVIDSKYQDRQSVILEYSQIVREAKMVDPAILDRIVPQVYDEDMFWLLMQVYPFRSVIFTLYKTPWTPESVYDFCFRTGCRFVTMRDAKLTSEIAALWDTLDIRIGVHTVNDPDAAHAYFAMGADMIYTDYLPPDGRQDAS